VDKAIAASDEAVDYAQAQLEALNNSVGQLIDINKNVVTVAQAIKDLQSAMQGAGMAVPTPTLQNTPSKAPSVVPTTPSDIVSASTGAPAKSTAADPGYKVATEDKALRESVEALLIALKLDSGKIRRVLESASAGDSLRISVADDEPLAVQVTP
jgi:hypothetical protein